MHTYAPSAANGHKESVRPDPSSSMVCLVSSAVFVHSHLECLCWLRNAVRCCVFVTGAPLGGAAQVYSVAMNSTATLLVSGGPENGIRVWDPRSALQVAKLKVPS